MGTGRKNLAIALNVLLVPGCFLAALCTQPAPTRAGTRSTNPSAVPLAADASALPRGKSPVVVSAPSPREGKPSASTVGAASGWSREVLQPQFVDRRRRIPRTTRPKDFGAMLRPGERFRFDVTFAGNPAGLAEAEVVAVVPDPRGGPPAGAQLLRLEGHARTSGVVSLLATVTDDMTTLIDARTGAAVSCTNVIDYQGWAPRKYKHRVTEQTYEGRGHVRIIDTKDGKAKKKIKRAPLDTFDPLSAMAWVRSLELEAGERAKAHAVDGTTLLRVEIESKGRRPMKNVPSIVTALEIGTDEIQMIEGVLTRVDEYDQAIAGKRVYKLRAWLSADERRIPLVLESDMWVGAIRLELTSYDPPSSTADRPASDRPSASADLHPTTPKAPDRPVHQSAPRFARELPAQRAVRITSATRPIAVGTRIRPGKPAT